MGLLKLLKNPLTPRIQKGIDNEVNTFELIKSRATGDWVVVWSRKEPLVSFNSEVKAKTFMGALKEGLNNREKEE